MNKLLQTPTYREHAITHNTHYTYHVATHFRTAIHTTIYHYFTVGGYLVASKTVHSKSLAQERKDPYETTYH